MDVTLSQLFQEYQMFHRAKARTHEKASKAFRHLVQFAGDGPAKELSPGRVNKWQVWLSTQVVNARTGRPGLAGHTVKTTVGAAAQVFGWAIRQREVDGSNQYGLLINPFAQADHVVVDERLVRWYREDEARDILTSASEIAWRDPTKTLAWYAAILMALQCGLRKNEITNLRWEDVDLDAGKVQIRHRADCPGEYWQWLSKGKHEGDVPMGDLLWAAMLRLQEVRPWRYPFLMRRRYESLLARAWPLPELVRDNPANNWTREFRRIVARANAKRLAGGCQVIDGGDFHQLRKTAATWLAERGVPEHFVQATLRHASADTTRKHYVGCNRRQCEEAVRAAINAVAL